MKKACTGWNKAEGSCRDGIYTKKKAGGGEEKKKKQKNFKEKNKK